LLCILSCMSDA
jgi:MFS superfamily sulfate permease-like transporter